MEAGVDWAVLVPRCPGEQVGRYGAEKLQLIKILYLDITVKVCSTNSV